MPPPSKLEQAQALIDAGKHEQARQLLQRILQADPRDPASNDLMRIVLVAQGKLDQALFYAERAHRAAPDHPGAMADYGALLAAAGKNAQAEPILRRAVELDPQNRQGHFAFVALLFTLNRIADAEAAARHALAHLPDDRDLTMKLAAALLNLGLAEQATPLLSALLFRNPDDHSAAESLATIINYDPSADRQRVFQAHLNAGRLLQQTSMVQTYRHEPRPARAAGGKIRLGILSPDLRQHSVGFFIEPIIEHLDRSRFELFVYDTARRGDHVTERLRRHPSTWRRAAAGGMPAPQLAAGIFADRLDALVELSGLTAGHSLDALRLRPAPVQITYLGFPNTTGLPTMDGRIVDAHTDPAADADALATERLIRLDPCFICYRPPEDAPPPRTGRGAGEPVTFGCFNALTKINDPLLKLWARVLASVPGSRLLIKARELCSPDVREHLARRCAAAGIERARVEIAEPTESLHDHLAQYQRVDVALDSFPYHGTTTTCEALWMGVPVVTLVGDRHASRVGLSLLSCVGHGAWCAADTEQYVQRAAELAANAPTGADIRAAMGASALCDAPGFVRRFERVIESTLKG